MMLNHLTWWVLLCAIFASPIHADDQYRNHPVYPSCGLYGLVVIANEIGIPLTCEEVVHQHENFRDAQQNFLEISEAAKSFQLGLRGVQGDGDALRRSSTPLIVAVSQEHFEVVREIADDRVVIVDNSGIQRHETWDDYLAAFRGYALIVDDSNSPSELPNTLLFYNTSADFGWIPSNPQLEYSFRGRNYSFDPVQIRNAVSSCGCASVRVEPETVQFGEEAIVTVRINKNQNQGELSEYVLLEIVGQNHPPRQVQLEIKAQIGHPYTFYPNRIGKDVLAGNFIEPVEIQWGITDPSERGSWEIVEIATRSGKDLASAEISGNSILVHFNQEITIGEYSDTLWVNAVRSTGETAFAQIPLEINVQGDIRANESRLSFGVVNRNESVERVLTLHSFSRTPFVIESYVSDIPLEVDLIHCKEYAAEHSLQIVVKGENFIANQAHLGSATFLLLSSNGEKQECKVSLSFLRGIR